MISFRAVGAPIPQGSMKVINGHVIHSRGSALAVWRSAVAWAAKNAGAVVTDKPIAMTMVFIMPRPKTVKRELPTVPPDLDKLVRAILDALTGIAYTDDSQVVSISAHKIYGEHTGVEVRLEEK